MEGAASKCSFARVTLYIYWLGGILVVAIAFLGGDVTLIPTVPQQPNWLGRSALPRVAKLPSPRTNTASQVSVVVFHAFRQQGANEVMQ